MVFDGSGESGSLPPGRRDALKSVGSKQQLPLVLSLKMFFHSRVVFLCFYMTEMKALCLVYYLVPCLLMLIEVSVELRLRKPGEMSLLLEGNSAVKISTILLSTQSALM